MNDDPRDTEHERQARREYLPGDRDQWKRVEAARAKGGRDRERAEIATRDALMFGTDPSWFGY